MDGLVAESCFTLVIPRTVACQAPLSMGFSRQDYWSGLPFPSPRVCFLIRPQVNLMHPSGRRAAWDPWNCTWKGENGNCRHSVSVAISGLVDGRPHTGHWTGIARRQVWSPRHSHIWHTAQCSQRAHERVPAPAEEGCPPSLWSGKLPGTWLLSQDTKV